MPNRRIDDLYSEGCVAIVEDERISRLALSALLADQGYQTRAFASAEEMLSTVEDEDSQAPAVLLVDLDLPGMSGMELLSLLEHKFAKLHAVLITAAESDDIDRFCREHVVDYMRKPLNLSQLLTLLPQSNCH